MEKLVRIKSQGTLQKQDWKSVTLTGLMKLGQLDDGRHTADFACCEDALLEQVAGTFRVQIQRDGNVYMTENRKRIRKKPLFRQDNSSMSLGRNHMYYFVFWLPEDELAELPEKLVKQANEAAAKASGLLFKKAETRR